MEMRTLRMCAYSGAFLLLMACSCRAVPQGPTSASTDQQGGQTPLKQLTLEQLANVEVTTVSRSPEQVWKTAAAIYVITQQDIQNSGVATIPDALRLAPGVEVAQIDSNKWSIGIRGFGSRLDRDVLVMIDGRSVYNPLLAGTYWEVQDYVLEDIDRIEVIRGPGGTIWGPNAVDGVINIITKNSSNTAGWLVSAVSGEVQHVDLSVRYGHSDPDGLSYRFYAKGFERGPEYHFDGDNYDSWRSIQGGFRMDWKKNARDYFTFQGDMYDEGAGETVSVTNYVPPSTETVEGTERLSGGNLLGRWTRMFSERNDLQLQVYYDRTSRIEPNFGDVRNSFDADYIQRVKLGSRNQFTFGLSALASHGHELQFDSGLFFIPSVRTDQIYTGFVQDSISIVANRLTFEAGTKIIHTNYTGVNLEPSGRLLWTPTDTETVWAAVTRAVRTPSDAERDFYLSSYLGPGPGGLPFFARFNANPNFTSEILDGYELGYRHLFGKTVYLDIAGFFNQYYNLFSEDITGPITIETSPPPAPIPLSTYLLLPAEFGNGLEGSTIGGEIAPEWKPTSFWSLKGSYSYLHMALKRGPGSQDIGTAPIVDGSSPQQEVSLQSELDLPKHFAFDFTFRYVSALTALDIPAYTTGGARLGWTFKRQFEFSVIGANLFQPYHLEYANSPGPNVAIRRSIYGRLIWTSREN